MGGVHCASARLSQRNLDIRGRGADHRQGHPERMRGEIITRLQGPQRVPVVDPRIDGPASEESWR